MIARTLCLLCLFLALPAQAAARPPAIGIGEQKASMFDDPHWQRLGLRDVRYIAPWDALRDPVQRAKLDTWMAGARASGSRVVLGFAHSLRSERLARTLPAPWRFEHEFRRFRARYPDVRDWIVWNEANHPFSLTAGRPRRAAQYFDVVAWNCPGCRIVAADVLDVSGMTAWVRRFQRHAVNRPRIWGLHNYVDANKLKDTGTRALLAITTGKIWFTETGGWSCGASSPARRSRASSATRSTTRRGRRPTRCGSPASARGSGASTCTTGARRTRSRTGTRRSSARAAGSAPPTGR